jgi:hypothetical protein
MPTISSFFGIVVRMYYDDHPPPHFHVYSGDQSATIAIDTLEVTEGRLSRRTLSLVLEWASEHRAELRTNWALAESHRPLNRIDPLV